MFVWLPLPLDIKEEFPDKVLGVLINIDKVIPLLYNLLNITSDVDIKLVPLNTRGLSVSLEDDMLL